MGDVEVKRYEAVPSGSQTFVIERPSGATMCMCPGPEHERKAAVIVRALNYDSRVHGDRSHAVADGSNVLEAFGKVIGLVPVPTPVVSEKVAGRLSGSEN